MCPIAPVAHLDVCIIMAMCSITPIPITHVPHHPAPDMLMCPIAHVPYCPCIPLPYHHIDLEGGHATLPICPIIPVSNGAHR